MLVAVTLGTLLLLGALVLIAALSSMAAKEADRDVAKARGLSVGSAVVAALAAAVLLVSLVVTLVYARKAIAGRAAARLAAYAGG